MQNTICHVVEKCLLLLSRELRCVRQTASHTTEQVDAESGPGQIQKENHFYTPWQRMGTAMITTIHF